MGVSGGVITSRVPEWHSSSCCFFMMCFKKNPLKVPFFLNICSNYLLYTLCQRFSILFCFTTKRQNWWYTRNFWTVSIQNVKCFLIYITSFSWISIFLHFFNRGKRVFHDLFVRGIRIVIYSPTPKQNNKFHSHVNFLLNFLYFLISYVINWRDNWKTAIAIYVQEAQVILLWFKFLPMSTFQKIKYLLSTKKV